MRRAAATQRVSGLAAVAVFLGMTAACFSAGAPAAPAAPDAATQAPAPKTDADSPPAAQPATPQPAPTPAGPAATPGPQAPSLSQLTGQMIDLDKALRRATDSAERKRLAEELEKVKHQMGPRDASGARIRCQAMWHDTALEMIEADLRRMAGRPGGSATIPASATTPADGRACVRRMAAACLSHGWRIYTGRTKYQVDAFGQYLVNNLKLLDGLFDSAAGWAAREPKADTPADEKTAYQSALEGVRQGLALMVRAAETMEKTPSAQEAALVPPLGEFAQGLAAVREADLAMAELARRRGKSGGLASEAAEVALAEPPPATPYEKQRLAYLKGVSARLKGDAWAPIVAYVERFALVAEGGFQVPRARPKARELLDQLDRAVTLAEELGASQIVFPEYLSKRRAEMMAAFRLMESAATRDQGYARLGEVAHDDRFRRQIESAGLNPASAVGLMRAYYVEWPKLRDAAVAESLAQGRQIQSGCLAVAATLDKMKSWSPKDMAARLQEYYGRLSAALMSEVERAGSALPDNLAVGLPALANAASIAGDLELIVRADAAVKAVTKYRPARASAIYGQVVRAAADLAGRSAGSGAARTTLEGLVRPFEDLVRFPVLEAEYQRAGAAIVGRTYPAAVAMASQEIGAGIDAASAGDPTPLRLALEAQHMFGLLRLRAVAETYRLDKAGVANLATFSIPEKVWSGFVERLDQKLRAMLADYAKSGRAGRGAWLRQAADWAAVYQAVAAGQRITIDSRPEGEADLDFLLANLSRVSDPAPSLRAWHGWLVGYHAAEAAMTMDAGLDSVAEWHRSMMRGGDMRFSHMQLEPARPPPRAKATS